MPAVKRPRAADVGGRGWPHLGAASGILWRRCSLLGARLAEPWRVLFLATAACLLSRWPATSHPLRLPGAQVRGRLRRQPSEPGRLQGQRGRVRRRHRRRRQEGLRGPTRESRGPVSSSELSSRTASPQVPAAQAQQGGRGVASDITGRKEEKKKKNPAGFHPRKFGAVQEAL